MAGILEVNVDNLKYHISRKPKTNQGCDARKKAMLWRKSMLSCVIDVLSLIASMSSSLIIVQTMITRKVIVVITTAM